MPRLLDYLESILAAGRSLIGCSHHPQELERLCGAVLRLEAGRPAI